MEKIDKSFKKKYSAPTYNKTSDQNLINRLSNSFSRKSRVGEVHRGVTKYIDVETKAERNYVVVKDKNGTVSIAKLKSIKNFNNDGTNADVALLEIDKEKYGLEKRTGVDFQRFSNNRISHQPLRLENKKVFPEQKQRFKLSSHDTHKVIKHTEKRKKPRH